MKIYNVLFESNYENEDVQSDILSFKNRDDAVKCLEKALEDEIRDGVYTDEEVKSRLTRDGDDFFCFYHEEWKSNWKFRCTIYETELV